MKIMISSSAGSMKNEVVAAPPQLNSPGLPAMSRSLFSEAAYNGIGFGLGFAVTMNPAQTLIAGSPGEFNWGGAATTSFFIDPAEELIMIFMTQVLPSSAYPLRRELRTMVYAAITDSNL